ncbi:hypothetical protein MJ1_0302 [Nanobdella aerobiophila]|uniref:Archaeal Type IV pilin N-terminal domain-containing protein n=1 Tax=Nanobdella aerobiophila TaxID=2586965 RepID=A0A915SY16_9ARCH|nr:archaellin/type IV pilin N-terminal domain-containing protein [Nanobdella aerobiophila]BBL45470.1 hypothetical protein MJ1_0302 [Nanobdella aerobiophila]
MRSISPIIATILIIVITVAIAGLTYAFLSGLFSGLTSSTSNQVSRQSQYISFSITNSYCSNNILYIDIYNNGNVPIVINNNTVLTINNGNNNIVSINGNNIICNNNNTILQGSTDTCYINNSLCIYNPSNNNNPQITLDYQGVGNNNNLGNGYLVGYFTNPLPITIYNTQNISTPTPFQQDIAICNGNPSVGNNFAYVDNPILYGGINSNGQNAYFTTTSGSSPNIYSWYEGQESISNVLCDVWWVNLPNGIPANSNITIYMGIGSTSTNYYQQDYPYVGEAPQLSSTYGEYDNGNDVFDLYFNGNTPTSDFTLGPGNSLSSNVSILYNGENISTLELVTQALDSAMTYYKGIPPGGYVAESFIETVNPPDNTMSWAGLVNTSIASSLEYGMGVGTDADDAGPCSGPPNPGIIFWNGSGYMCGYSSNVSIENGSYIAEFVYPGLSSSTVYGYLYNATNNQNIMSLSVNVNTLSGSSEFYFGLPTGDLGATGQTIYFNYALVMAYPPNGVMPSISIS